MGRRVIRIRLLGRVTIERDGQPSTDPPAKALELLSFLLLHRDRGHTREELAVLLWPDASTALARKYLRQTLWQLQSALAAELLLLNSGWVRIDADADWWLDVDVFERAWEGSRDVAGARWATRRQDTASPRTAVSTWATEDAARRRSSVFGSVTVSPDPPSSTGCARRDS